MAEGSELLGKTIGEVVASENLEAVAHLPADGAARFLLEVNLGAPLVIGDRLIVSGPLRELAGLLAGDKRMSDALRWAGYIQRYLRVVRRTLAEMDIAVAACTIALVAVLVTSTLVLHIGVAHYSVVDALFQTVSVMATGAPLPEKGLPEWLKVFVSGLRIIGAALTAVFIAAVTNYLLRAGLRGAMEVRRVPDGGHVIVCGLSSIGFRVVEELIDWGERVVVIERDPNNRFTPTVRQLGAAVIYGDAGGHRGTASSAGGDGEAVIVATHNDVVNLEVALLVRELNERQRVVLLQADPRLAQMLREAANVHLAVSVPALAAPAFLAALLGDKVRNVLMVRGHLFALLDLVVQQEDGVLNNATVRTLAVDYRFLPLAVVPSDGPPPRVPMNARLATGDRLVALVGLTDLDRLTRRQPSSAAFAVEVSGFPLPTRAWLEGLVRTWWNLSAEEAAARLVQLPLRFTDLTRGQAEELLWRLGRERVAAQLHSLEVRFRIGLTAPARDRLWNSIYPPP